MQKQGYTCVKGMDMQVAQDLFSFESPGGGPWVYEDFPVSGGLWLCRTKNQNPGTVGNSPELPRSPTVEEVVKPPQTAGAHPAELPKSAPLPRSPTLAEVTGKNAEKSSLTAKKIIEDHVPTEMQEFVQEQSAGEKDPKDCAAFMAAFIYADKAEANLGIKFSQDEKEKYQAFLKEKILAGASAAEISKYVTNNNVIRAKLENFRPKEPSSENNGEQKAGVKAGDQVGADSLEGRLPSNDSKEGSPGDKHNDMKKRLPK